MIKLFTHRDDPDGIGSVILTRMLTEDFDFTLCKGIKELDEHIKVFLKNQECKNYDQVLLRIYVQVIKLYKRLKKTKTYLKNLKFLIIIKVQWMK